MGRPVETFKRGQKVYTERGYEYEYFGELDGVVLCCPSKLGYYATMDGPDEYEYFGDTEVVTEPIFSRPPSPKLHADIAEQKAELERSKEELVEVRREISRLSREAKAMENLHEQHEAFEQARKFIMGEWTHMVQHENYYKIGFREEVRDEKRVTLTLHLSSINTVNRKVKSDFYSQRLDWWRDDYKVKTTFHDSEEEARAIVQAAFDEHVRNYLYDPSRKCFENRFEDTHDWLEIPEELTAYRVAQKEKKAAEKRARLEAELAALEDPNE